MKSGALTYSFAAYDSNEVASRLAAGLESAEAPSVHSVHSTSHHNKIRRWSVLQAEVVALMSSSWTHLLNEVSQIVHGSMELCKRHSGEASCCH